MSEIKTDKISSLTGTNNDITIDPDGTGDTIVASGNVGIGTASPTSKLSVVSGTNAGITVNDGTVNTILFNTSSANGSMGTTTNHPMAFYSNNAERMRIDSSGNVRLANTSMNIDNSGNTATGLSVASTGVTHIATSANNTSLLIQRVSDTGTDNAIYFLYGSTGVGSVTVNNSSTAYNTSSDYRLKTDVTYDWDATSRLKQLKPARFAWIADGDEGVPVDGFLAHEVQSVVPEAISGTHNEVDDEGNPVYQGIDQSKLVPLLVKTIQELEARITALETE